MLHPPLRRPAFSATGAILGLSYFDIGPLTTPGLSEVDGVEDSSQIHYVQHHFHICIIKFLGDPLLGQMPWRCLLHGHYGHACDHNVGHPCTCGTSQFTHLKVEDPHVLVLWCQAHPAHCSIFLHSVAVLPNWWHLKKRTGVARTTLFGTLCMYY